MPENAHLIVVKYPQAGKVKTRLGKHIGDQKAADLYKSLVESLINNSNTSSSYDIIVFIEPYKKLADFNKWLGDSVQYLPQSEGDIGERMQSAFCQAFELGYKKCVLTGSDIPDLNHYIIEDAFNKLDHHKAVIGKAFDGGYYLIGFNQDTFTDTIFENISWSTDIVFAQTMQIFQNIGYDIAEVECLRDLDDIEDYHRLSSPIKDKL